MYYNTYIIKQLINRPTMLSKRGNFKLSLLLLVFIPLFMQAARYVPLRAVL